MKKLGIRFISLMMATMLWISTGYAADDTVSVKDDFYTAINGEWIASAVIPSDKPAAGGFMDLTDGVKETLMADFEKMLDGEVEPTTEELKSFIEFYRLAGDYETRDALGTAPLLPYIEKIEGLQSLQDYAQQWAQWDMEGMPSPISAMVMADMQNADMNALYMAAPSLFLMDTSYYADAATKEALQGLFAMTQMELLQLVGKSAEEAESIVSQALAFDESLVPYIRSAEEASDYTKMYNPIALTELDASIAAFDMADLLAQLVGEAPETVVSIDPKYFAAIDTLINDETFEQLKSWLMVSTINSFSSFLSDEFRVVSGGFMRAMTGIEEETPKDEAAYSLASMLFGEVVGLYYGQEYFGEEAKQDVTLMVKGILEAYESRLLAIDWIGDKTREMAIRKLDGMNIHVGYPDAIRPEYSLMQTVSAADGGTLVGNAMEFTRISKESMYSKWNKPVDRGMWPLSASDVNAMYSPMENSINFPAAILQAPFYSLEQSASANYGGIGAVIAHEISHAFDPNGAKFDELGNLADWWTAEDYAAFEERSQAMIDAFDGVEHAGGTVNGTLTVAENVADAGGLACALDALKLQEDIDFEAFFTNWGVIWRQKALPEYEALLLTLDVHAPNKLRTNIQLQNMDDFHEAFDIQPEDGMYLAPEARVTIW